MQFQTLTVPDDMLPLDGPDLISLAGWVSVIFGITIVVVCKYIDACRQRQRTQARAAFEAFSHVVSTMPVASKETDDVPSAER